MIWVRMIWVPAKSASATGRLRGADRAPPAASIGPFGGGSAGPGERSRRNLLGATGPDRPSRKIFLGPEGRDRSSWRSQGASPGPGARLWRIDPGSRVPRSRSANPGGTPRVPRSRSADFGSAPRVPRRRAAIYRKVVLDRNDFSAELSSPVRGRGSRPENPRTTPRVPRSGPAIPGGLRGSRGVVLEIGGRHRGSRRLVFKGLLGACRLRDVGIAHEASSLPSLDGPKTGRPASDVRRP